MSKIEPFEKYTSHYEDWFKINKFAYESELRAIREQLPESGNGIEIGVGSGRFATLLGIKIGIEPSEKMRDIAQQRGIEVLDALAEDLPFHDSQFDFVLMVTTICFLDDIQVAFKEAYRILRSGGYLVIGFVDKNSPIGKLYLKNKDKSVFYKLATFYSVNEVVSHMKEAGFRKFNFVQTIFDNLAHIKKLEPIKKGFGEGSFVVIKGAKL